MSTRFAPGIQTEEVELRQHASWRQLVMARTRRLRAELDILTHRQSGLDQTKHDAIEGLINTAEHAACAPQTITDRWEGTLIERAWTAVHDAEVLLVAEMQIEEARTWAQDVVTVGPGAKAAALPTPAAVAQRLRQSYDLSDAIYEQQRSFRNRLIRLSGIGAAISLLLVFTGSAGMWTLGTEALTGRPIINGTADMVTVALFGMAGAFLTGLSAVSKATSVRTPFRLGMYQLLVKLAVGPAFAFIGLLFVNSGAITGVAPLSSFSLVLVWAAAFGGTQQMVTKALDARAGVLATHTTTGKDSLS